MITTEKGTKSPNDRKVFINGHQVTFEEIAEACLIFFENEDERYPPPRYLGGQMLINFVQDVYNSKEITDEILRKYSLGKYRP